MSYSDKSRIPLITLSIIIAGYLCVLTLVAIYISTVSAYTFRDFFGLGLFFGVGVGLVGLVALLIYQHEEPEEETTLSLDTSYDPDDFPLDAPERIAHDLIEKYKDTSGYYAVGLRPLGKEGTEVQRLVDNLTKSGAEHHRDRWRKAVERIVRRHLFRGQSPILSDLRAVEGHLHQKEKRISYLPDRDQVKEQRRVIRQAIHIIHKL